MTYFYCNIARYKIGDVIPPGKWGRGYDGYEPAKMPPQNWLMLSRELLFEKIRYKNFIAKPSRFESTFLCETLPELDKFIKTYNRNADIRYEVNLLDDSLPSHIGDYTACHWHHNMNLKQMEQIAFDYWKGSNIV